MEHAIYYLLEWVLLAALCYVLIVGF